MAANPKKAHEAAAALQSTNMSLLQPSPKKSAGEASKISVGDMFSSSREFTGKAKGEF